MYIVRRVVKLVRRRETLEMALQDERDRRASTTEGELRDCADILCCRQQLVRVWPDWLDVPRGVAQI